MNLVGKMSKRAQKFVKSLEPEDGLIDGCKYMLYFKDEYTWDDGSTSLPCRNVREANHFTLGAIKSEENKKC